jgi:hypothetical protein
MKYNLLGNYLFWDKIELLPNESNNNEITQLKSFKL